MCDLESSFCRTAGLASCCKGTIRRLWEHHTLQISYELGVEVLVVDVLPDGQEAIASGAESLRNCRQEQQQAREDELHLEEQTAQCRLEESKRMVRKKRIGLATTAIASVACGSSSFFVVLGCWFVLFGLSPFSRDSSRLVNF